MRRYRKGRVTERPWGILEGLRGYFGWKGFCIGFVYSRRWVLKGSIGGRGQVKSGGFLQLLCTLYIIKIRYWREKKISFWN